MSSIVSGSVYKCGDDVTAYQIIARNRWPLGLNPQELGKWAMEGENASFLNVENGLRLTGCSILVAGRDFGGGGKSIEHPIAALQGAGIELLIAESFSRYAFRNAINRGLPAIICPGITSFCEAGDVLTVDLTTGSIRNAENRCIQGQPLPELVLRFRESGGMLNYYREKLSEKSGMKE